MIALLMVMVLLSDMEIRCVSHFYPGSVSIFFFISTRAFDLIITDFDISLPVEDKFSNLTIAEPSVGY